MNGNNIDGLTSMNLDQDVYVFPTTYPQKQIWFINQLDPESPAYNIPFAYDIDGELDAGALKGAVNEIIRRHEIFRTIFRDTDNGLVQIVFPEMIINVELTAFSSDQKLIEDHIKQNSLLPFDLGNGPLIRASIIKRGVQQFILLFNFHHIILDHISIVQFADELRVLYKAFINNQSSPLVEVELQYGDYSVWQKENLSHQALKPKMEFWEDQLKNKKHYLDFPSDRKRPSIPSMKGAENKLSFSKELTSKLKKFSRSESVSMFITLITAYSILLSRYSNQDEIAIGTPFGNRGFQPELEKIMGCFINTLPIMTDLTGDPSFKEVLKRVRSTVFSVAAHQETPFEMIVEKLNPKRDSSHNPIFQVGFTFQEPPMEIALEGCKVKSQCLHNDSAKFDILVWLWERNGRIQGILEYNTDIFSYETLSRFSNHYEIILEDVVNRPDVPISRLNIISDSEKITVLKEWNNTNQTFNNTSSIHGLFELNINQYKNKLAVTCDGNSYTYSELDKRANQLAHYLIQKGVKENALVAVCVERSLDMLVAILSVLKSGGCYIPIDPDYPQDRINYMLDDSAAKILITQSFIVNHIVLSDSIDVIEIDMLRKIVNQFEVTSPDVQIDKNDLAYIIYTSGSTGKPKGVMVPHSSGVNFLQSMAKSPGFTDNDRLLAVTTLSFDIAVLELYLPLTQGGTVVIATSDEVVDGNELIDLLEKHNINVMFATPATWRLLLANDWLGKKDLKVLCGGEALPRNLLIELLPKVLEFWNLYGPTETTICSTCFQLQEKDGFILIGKPISNTQCYVLDKHLQPVPIGVSGELYIGGSGVTLGYLNLDTMTTQRYIVDPFSNKGRLYRTGDLVRFKPDGNLEYIQRVDNQVKVRGFRIELGEIETILSRIESINQVVVVVNEEREGDSRLVAYIIFNEELSNTSTEIRAYIRKDLPDYMVPQYFIEIDELPLTPNGKINKNKLPSPFGNDYHDDGVKVAPRNASEEQLIQIWANVLKLDIKQIGVHDNFFDIGGHSLLSMHVISEIRKASGTKLSPRVMVFSTLEHIAKQCDFKDIDLSGKIGVANNKSGSKIKSVLSKIFK